MNKTIPLPEHVRIHSKSFGWIDHRLLRDGWITKMSLEEFAVYTFLVIAADRSGVSYYRKEKMGIILGLDFSQVDKALECLLKKSLIAFEAFSTYDPNGFYQLLAIPDPGNY